MKNLSMDMTTPCNDCPFRLGVDPKLYGSKNIGPVLGDIYPGSRFQHSCHKTDPRAQRFIETHPPRAVKHCAGMLLMAIKEGIETTTMTETQLSGEWKPENMIGTDEVHTRESLLEEFEKSHGESVANASHVCSLPEWV